MAAGRVVPSRRRDYDVLYSKKEYDYCCKNGSSRGAVESNRGRDDHGVGYNKNGYSGYHLSSNGRDLGFIRTRKDKNGEISKYEADDGVQLLPLEKKRKFSPIIWDLKEKEVRISSKNRVVPASTTLSPPPSPPVLLNVASDEGLEDSSVKVVVVESSVSKSPAFGSPLLLTEQFQSGDDREEGQVEEEEFGQARNLSSSRWASDSDSPGDIPPLSDGEDTPKKEERFRSSSSCSTRRSTPESGEICREGSEGDRSGLSGSVERGCSVVTLSDDEYSENELQNGDVMDIDATHNESAGVEEPTVPSHRSMNMLQGCRSVYEFERLNKINEGTYGIVYRARDKKTSETVALKKVKMNVGKDYLEYGFPMSSLREINILLSFNHPSIVNVKEVVMGSDLDSIFMVMEYMEHDLKGLMDKMKQMKQQRFSTSEVKCLMLQLLEGVKYLHDNWVLHRDLKTSNILLNNKGELKVCDLGLSRQYGSPLKLYTPLVVTLHYRAPELLLGAKQYSTAIDMWSVGCIMAELLTNEPLFQGKTEVEQLQKIFKVLGTPNETIWPGLSKLPGAKANFVKQPYNLLRKKFPATSFTGSPVLSDSGFDLLNKLLTYDPAKRITADAALNHEWFRDVPLAKSKEFMPTFPPQHAQR